MSYFKDSPVMRLDVPLGLQRASATHSIQHQGMIGLQSIEAPANNLAHSLPMGGYGDAVDEPRQRQPRIELQMSLAATVVE